MRFRERYNKYWIWKHLLLSKEMIKNGWTALWKKHAGTV